jgi:hypothetical protein
MILDILRVLKNRSATFKTIDDQHWLKVDSNKKKGGQEGDSNSASVWHCGD